MDASSPTTLRAILTSDSPLLVLDAASTRVQVGLLRAGHEPLWWSERGEAGVALFKGVNHLLDCAGLCVGDLGAVAYCDGPGSILGIRTSAAAIRAWRAAGDRECPAVWSYRGLDLVAHHAALGGARDTSAVADARRDSWHTVLIDREGNVGSLRRVSSDELAALASRVITPSDFRTWSTAPVALEIVDYNLATLLPATESVALFSATTAPDAFLHEEPSYRMWTPAIHRTPEKAAPTA